MSGTENAAQPWPGGSDYRRILTLLPEIRLIKSDSLRQRVALVWRTAWEMSGYEDLGDVPFMPNVPNYTLIRHTRGTTLSAIGIARSLVDIHGFTVDMDRLIAASILHDAAKCVEFEHKADGRDGRSELGKNYPHSYLVCEIGRRVGVPDEILHLVAAHSSTSPVVIRFVEGAILTCADMADAASASFVSRTLLDPLTKGLPRFLFDDIFDSE